MRGVSKSEADEGLKVTVTGTGGVTAHYRCKCRYSWFSIDQLIER